jgi:WD40 repeat protein
VAFSPDGKTLASADGTLFGPRSEIKLWNVKTGKEKASLKGHKGPVFSVAFSPDGKTLASGSKDKTIKLWEVETGKELPTRKRKDGAGSIAFSPDSKLLAAGHRMKVWDVETGEEKASLKGHTGYLSSVSFSPVQGTRPEEDHRPAHHEGQERRQALPHRLALLVRSGQGRCRVPRMPEQGRR